MIKRIRAARGIKKRGSVHTHTHFQKNATSGISNNKSTQFLGSYASDGTIPIENIWWKERGLSRHFYYKDKEYSYSRIHGLYEVLEEDFFGHPLLRTKLVTDKSIIKAFEKIIKEAVR